MNQRPKNILLLSLLMVLVTITIALITWKPGSQGINVDEARFSVENTAELIQVKLTSPFAQIDLAKQDGVWVLNQGAEADAYLMELLLSLLNRVRISREIEGPTMESVKLLMDSIGVSVELLEHNLELRRFKVVGQPETQNTYFMDPAASSAFLMRIPGYSDYLAPIFGLKPIQWRSRIVFNSSWRSIKRLHVGYPGNSDQDFAINYRQNFLEVDGVSELDTVKMMDYVQQYSQFSSEGFIDETDYPQYQRLISDQQPLIVIDLEDINPLRNGSLELFPQIPGDPYFLGRVGGEHLALFNASRIELLMVTKENFTIKSAQQ